MNSIIYQIKVSDPSKCGSPALANACFSSHGLAAATLRNYGFTYSEEADLWHNGHTEAWITRCPVHDNAVMLGAEEVQLR